jgi:hypothetical protein
VSSIGDNRISCYAHSQNLALDFAIKTLTEIEIKKKINKDFNEKISTIVKTCKELVSHFNHAELKNKLNKTLKPIIITRFNTHYEMFESISANYDKICDVLKTREELHNYPIDKALLTGIIEILRPFREATNELSSSSYPTLSIVLPWIIRIERSLVAKENELKELKAFKKVILRGMALKLRSRLNIYHKIACFLDPRFRKSTVLLNELETNSVKEWLISNCNFEKEASSSASRIGETTPESNAHSDKFSEFFEQNEESYGSTTVEKEIRSYLDDSFVMPKLKENERFDPIVMYWKNKLNV